MSLNSILDVIKPYTDQELQTLLKEGSNLERLRFLATIAKLKSAEKDLLDALNGKSACRVCGKAEPCTLQSDVDPESRGDTPCVFLNALVEPMAELKVRLARAEANQGP